MNVTRAEQRAATRRAVVDAAIAIVMTEGLGAVTTRRVAGDVRVSQSTVMYHFGTREELLATAVSELADAIERQARAHFDEAIARGPLTLDRYLDVGWSQFKSPQALAAAQLWAAVWTEPSFARTVQDLELRIFAVAVDGARPLMDLFPDEASALAFIDLGLSAVRGLVVSIPVWGMDTLDARWEVSKRALLSAVGHAP